MKFKLRRKSNSSNYKHAKLCGKKEKICPFLKTGNAFNLMCTTEMSKMLSCFVLSHFFSFHCVTRWPRSHCVRLITDSTTCSHLGDTGRGIHPASSSDQNILIDHAYQRAAELISTGSKLMSVFQRSRGRRRRPSGKHSVMWSERDDGLSYYHNNIKTVIIRKEKYLHMKTYLKEPVWSFEGGY